jgi:hypothetical protein
MESRSWQLIENAPRDGTLVELTQILMDGTVTDIWRMKWDPEKINGLYPGVKGFWTTSDGAITWYEDTDGSPTHWRRIYDN